MQRKQTVLLSAVILFAICLYGSTGTVVQAGLNDTAAVGIGNREAGESGSLQDITAMYLGVSNYGAEETNRDHMDEFLYRFEVDGEETCFYLQNSDINGDGEYEYPLQNMLKEGYDYILTVEEDMVTDVSEIPETSQVMYDPKVDGTPGERTLKNFLMTALEPVGTTLYIYGGGWDWQDEGSAVQTRTLEVSPDWVIFFDSQDSAYTFKEQDGDETKADPSNSYYPYGEYNEYYYAGLDCSGFLGWVLYNTFETESGRDGYVSGSTGLAKGLSENGWGEWTQDIQAPDGENGYEMKPGDIMSINGHVWISLGTCEDGSVVIVHSTPSYSRAGQPGGGVQISAIGTEETCEASLLAEKYMSEYYPEWYDRYPIYLCDPDTYFSFEGDSAGRFSWETRKLGSGLSDPEHIQNLTPEEVLEELFIG